MTEVYSYAETRTRAQGNRYRQFPTLAKGRARFLPYARPEIKGPQISRDARFFALGACFARSLEKELQLAGRDVRSSPTGLGLPGSTTEQFQRYNIFNLDVGLNELTWALSSSTAGADKALLPLGETLADTQLSWTFAHEPDIAQSFRKIYNKSYAAVVDADVVLLATGGIEQWFDAEQGIYINSMPGPVADKLFPGRFELHRIGVQEAKSTLERTIELIRSNSNRDPIFYIAVSPVSQPMIFGPDDILVDQFYSKVVQRHAVEDVVNKVPGCYYLPALEAAMWSDFSYNYLENSMNHTNPNFAARMVASMLEASGADDVKFKEHHAKSHGQALLNGGGSSAALALCEEAFAVGSCQDPDLDALYIRALLKAHRRSEALRHAISRLETGTNITQMMREALSVGNGVITAEQIVLLIQIAEENGLPLEPISALKVKVDGKNTQSSRGRLSTIAEVMASKDYETVVRLANELRDEGGELSLRDQARLHQMLIRSLVAVEQLNEAVQVALAMMDSPLATEPVGFAAAEGVLRHFARGPDLECVLTKLRGGIPEEKLAGMEKALRKRSGVRA